MGASHVHDHVDLMRYVVSKTMKKVTVTRRGRKKQDGSSSSNAIPYSQPNEPVEAICDGPVDTRHMSVPLTPLDPIIVYYLEDSQICLCIRMGPAVTRTIFLCNNVRHTIQITQRP